MKYSIAGVLIVTLFPLSAFAANFHFQKSNGLHNSLKALYHLENLSDSSGNNNNLVPTGNAVFAPAKFHNGADFGHENGHLNNLAYTQTGSTTVSAWYKLNNLPSQGKYALIVNVGEGPATYVSHVIFINSQGVLYFYRQQQNFGGSYITTQIINDNLWHHVIYSYDADKRILRGFLDGSSVGTTSANGNGLSGYTGGIDIGGAAGDLLGETGGTFSLVSGAIDEVALFNAALPIGATEHLNKNHTKNLKFESKK